jgi:hypothetical protein
MEEFVALADAAILRRGDLEMAINVSALPVSLRPLSCEIAEARLRRAFCRGPRKRGDPGRGVVRTVNSGIEIGRSGVGGAFRA